MTGPWGGGKRPPLAFFTCLKWYAGLNSFPCYQKSYRPDQKGNAMAKPNYEFKKRQKELAKKKKKEEKKQRKQENKSVENDETEKDTTP